MTDFTTRSALGTALSHAQLDTNFSQSSQTKPGAYTVVIADNRDTIEYSGAGGDDFTLPDVASIVAASDTGDFEVTLKNVGTGTLGISKATGADTIDGSTVDLTVGTNGSVTLKTNQAGDGYNVTKESRNGKQTLFIPASAMRPTITNGCTPIRSVETTAGNPDMQVLDFVSAADNHAQFQLALPKQWDLGTVTYQVFWTTAGAVTTGVAWSLQSVAVPDNSTIDVAYGAAIVVTDNAQSQVEEMLVTSESAEVTIAGTLAVDEMCFFRLFRDVSDANDDMIQDARLIGIKLHITTRQVNDG